MSKKHTSRLASAGAALAALLLVCGCGSAFRQSGEAAPVTFGVLSDIQYADRNDSGARHYRASLRKLEECVADMNQREPVFVIQLGDIVDGYNGDRSRTTGDLTRVLAVLNELRVPMYHVLGNHCLRADREALLRLIGRERFYYDFSPAAAKGWRFVVLDGNEGGAGRMRNEQLNWFRSTLADASRKGERVICFCHYALLREAAPNVRMEKPEPLLAAMDEAGCVAAWFAGHDHPGGYALRNGVHHVTLRGMVEASTNAYALIELFPDRIREIGFGDEPSRELPLPLK